jgi:hypothetical protein
LLVVSSGFRTNRIVYQHAFMNTSNDDELAPGTIRRDNCCATDDDVAVLFLISHAEKSMLDTQKDLQPQQRWGRTQNEMEAGRLRRLYIESMLLDGDI